MQSLYDSHQCHTTKYVFSRLIGSGAYGKVFKARCKNTRRKVAIKYIEFMNTGAEHLVAVCREVLANSFLSGQMTNCYSVPLIDIYFPKEADPSDKSTITGIYLVFEYMQFTLRDLLL